VPPRSFKNARPRSNNHYGTTRAKGAASADDETAEAIQQETAEDDAEVDDDPSSSYKVRAEVVCPLCLDLWLDVVATPCGHRFCRTCLRRSLTRCSSRCPLCRYDLRHFDASVVPTDVEGDALLHALMPLWAIAQREADQAEHFELVVGNRSEFVPSMFGNQGNTHKWTLFVSLPGLQHHPLQRLIKRVEYELHPTFQPNVIVRYGPDFEFAAYGWGPFVVHCTIYWHLQTLPPTKVDHMLHFVPQGARTSIEVDLDTSQAMNLYQLMH